MVSIQRIEKKVKSLTTEYREKSHFFTPFDSLLFTLAPYIRWGNQRKHAAILKHLKKYADMSMPTEPGHEYPIDQACPLWVCWYQGQENSPPIVRACINSIRQHKGAHPVILLDKDNIAQYADIPRHIMEKVDRGIITITHFSDILRMTLLAQWGGFWIDATCLLSSCLPDYRLPFYTMRSGIPNLRHVHGGCDWTSFFIGTGKDNTVVKFLRNFLYSYWEHETHQIDYFLIDYAIELAYQRFPSFRQTIASIPLDNAAFGQLGHMLDKPYQAELWKDVLAQQTVHKLSWKLPYGKETFGDHITHTDDKAADNTQIEVVPKRKK